MRAQAAFEYMLVVMIVLAFLVPLWVYSATVSRDSTNELSLSYAKNAVESIATSADLVYSQGPPAKLKIGVYIPDGVQSFNITNRTIFLSISQPGGTTDVVAESRALINGTIPTDEGRYWLEIAAIEGGSYDINVQQA